MILRAIPTVLTIIVFFVELFNSALFSASPVCEVPVSSPNERCAVLYMLTSWSFVVVDQVDYAERRRVLWRTVVQVSLAVFDCISEVSYRHCREVGRTPIGWIQGYPEGLETLPDTVVPHSSCPDLVADNFGCCCALLGGLCCWKSQDCSRFSTFYLKIWSITRPFVWVLPKSGACWCPVYHWWSFQQIKRCMPSTKRLFGPFLS